jgi:hypothetical protein
LATVNSLTRTLSIPTGGVLIVTTPAALGRRDGERMIVKIGASLVSGLPRESDADRFGEALTRA